jgi:hypothetical protein
LLSPTFFVALCTLAPAALEFLHMFLNVILFQELAVKNPKSTGSMPGGTLTSKRRSKAGVLEAPYGIVNYDVVTVEIYVVDQ